MAKLLYQGHGSLRLTTAAGVVVYVDPYAGEGYDLPADLVLVTHQHYDHNQVDKMPHAAGCVVWQNMDSHPSPDTWFTRTFGEVTVEAVEAENDHHPLDQCVGYLVQADGLTLYFAGDTSQTRQMETLAERGIDYAFLPGDGIYNMDVAGAAACARLVGAKNNVPIHLAPGALFGEAGAARFAELAPNALTLRPGDEVEL